MVYQRLRQRAAAVAVALALATAVLAFLAPAQAAFAQTISATEGEQFSGQLTSVAATCQPVTSPTGTIDWGTGARVRPPASWSPAASY